MTQCVFFIEPLEELAEYHRILNYLRFQVSLVEPCGVGKDMNDNFSIQEEALSGFEVIVDGLPQVTSRILASG